MASVVFGVNCGFSGFWGELALVFFGVNCGFSGFWGGLDKIM